MSEQKERGWTDIKTKVIEPKGKQPAQRGTIRLNQRDTYRLVKWLHERKWGYGDSVAKVFYEAEAILNIEGLNKDHVRLRMEEFAQDLPIPKSPPITASAEFATDVVALLGVLLNNTQIILAMDDQEKVIAESFAKKYIGA